MTIRTLLAELDHLARRFQDHADILEFAIEKLEIRLHCLDRPLRCQVEYALDQGYMTVQEIVRLTEIPEWSVRKELRGLQAEGRIEQRRQHKEGYGSGRYATLYALKSQSKVNQQVRSG